MFAAIASAASCLLGAARALWSGSAAATTASVKEKVAILAASGVAITGLIHTFQR